MENTEQEEIKAEEVETEVVEEGQEVEVEVLDSKESEDFKENS